MTESILEILLIILLFLIITGIIIFEVAVPLMVCVMKKRVDNFIDKSEHEKNKEKVIKILDDFHKQHGYDKYLSNNKLINSDMKINNFDK